MPTVYNCMVFMFEDLIRCFCGTCCYNTVKCAQTEIKGLNSLKRYINNGVYNAQRQPMLPTSAVASLYCQFCQFNVSLVQYIKHLLCFSVTKACCIQIDPLYSFHHLLLAVVENNFVYCTYWLTACLHRFLLIFV